MVFKLARNGLVLESLTLIPRNSIVRKAINPMDLLATNLSLNKKVILMLKLIANKKVTFDEEIFLTVEH